MTDKGNKEIIQKIIQAVEHPDNFEHKTAITIHETREQKQRFFKHLFALVINFSKSQV